MKAVLVASLVAAGTALGVPIEASAEHGHSGYGCGSHGRGVHYAGYGHGGFGHGHGVH